MAAASCFSSNSSKAYYIIWSLKRLSYLPAYTVFLDISARIIVLVLYTKDKEVDLVGSHMVIRYDHRSSSNYSTHFPLAYSNYVFKVFKIVLFVVSACPFPYGCLKVKNLALIYHFEQESLNLVLMN